MRARSLRLMTFVDPDQTSALPSEYFFRLHKTSRTQPLLASSSLSFHTYHVLDNILIVSPLLLDRVITLRLVAVGPSFSHGEARNTHQFLASALSQIRSSPRTQALWRRSAVLKVERCSAKRTVPTPQDVRRKFIRAESVATE